jgi:hypothetical protein
LYNVSEYQMNLLLTQTIFDTIHSQYLKGRSSRAVANKLNSMNFNGVSFSYIEAKQLLSAYHKYYPKHSQSHRISSLKHTLKHKTNHKANHKTNHLGGYGSSSIAEYYYFPVWKYNQIIPLGRYMTEKANELSFKRESLVSAAKPINEAVFSVMGLGLGAHIMNSIVNDLLSVINMMFYFSQKKFVLAFIEFMRNMPVISYLLQDFNEDMMNYANKIDSGNLSLDTSVQIMKDILFVIEQSLDILEKRLR